MMITRQKEMGRNVHPIKLDKVELTKGASPLKCCQQCFKWRDKRIHEHIDSNGTLCKNR